MGKTQTQLLKNADRLKYLHALIPTWLQVICQDCKKIFQTQDLSNVSCWKLPKKQTDMIKKGWIFSVLAIRLKTQNKGKLSFLWGRKFTRKVTNRLDWDFCSLTYSYVIYWENSANLQKELTTLIDFWQELFNTDKCRVMRVRKYYCPQQQYRIS